MRTMKRLTTDDQAPVLRRGEFKKMIATGRAKVVRNNNNVVKVMRARLGMSQAEFATSFRLSLRTVQDWEQGRYEPDQIARNYLAVIEAHPKIVRKAVVDG